MIYEVGTWEALQEASLHYTPDRDLDSMSKVKYRKIQDAEMGIEQAKPGLTGETAKENRERRGEEKLSSKIGNISFRKERRILMCEKRCCFRNFFPISVK